MSLQITISRVRLTRLLQVLETTDGIIKHEICKRKRTHEKYIILSFQKYSLIVSYILPTPECSENKGDDFYYKIPNEITCKIKVKKYFYSGEEYELY